MFRQCVFVAGEQWSSKNSLELQTSRSGFFPKGLETGFFGSQWFDDGGVANFKGTFQPIPCASSIAQLGAVAGEVKRDAPVVREFSGGEKQRLPRFVHQAALLLSEAVIKPADRLRRQRRNQGLGDGTGRRPIARAQRNLP